MSTFAAQDYQTEDRTLAGYPVRITSYRLGDVFACKIDNIDPGATFARAQAATREDAIQEALGRATTKLEVTQRLADAQRQLREAAEMLAKL